MQEEKHHAVLLKVLAEQLRVLPGDIVDFELNVCDTQPGVIGGEFPKPYWSSAHQAQPDL